MTNTHRIIATAQDLGSSATTIKGAMRYLRTCDRITPDPANSRFRADWQRQQARREYRGRRADRIARRYGVSRSVAALMTQQQIDVLRMHPELAAEARQYGTINDISADHCAVLTHDVREYREWRDLDIRWLVGIDEGHVYATRVPGTCNSVADAMHWMTPSAVHNALDRDDRLVYRQGDIWAIGTPDERLLTAEIADHSALSWTRHSVERAGTGLSLVHGGGEHATVYLPVGYRWRLYRNARVANQGD